jgi:uncharacterized hydrophobic protein (TIGR00271 family)
MITLRIQCPTARTAKLIELLKANPAVAHLMVLSQGSVMPPGDVITVDVAREGVPDVLQRLKERGIGLTPESAITAEPLDLSVSVLARDAEHRVPGRASDSIIWDQMEQRTGEETQLSLNYLSFMVLATAIAAIGVLLDQPILIIGSMVVGPEFGPLASICVAAVRKHRQGVRSATTTLMVGFAVAFVTTVLFTYVMTGLGWFSASMLNDQRPLTEFIWRPDSLSWVVAALASAAGMLSLTSAKSGALIGVVISVTTVPALANSALAVAYGNGHEAWGSLEQFAGNIVSIILAGIVTLLVQRWFQTRVTLRRLRRLNPERRSKQRPVAR